MERFLPLSAALVLAACGTKAPVTAPPNSAAPDAGMMMMPPAEPEKNFSLLDVNATSPTHMTMVSPRDYLQKVTGWYFGHAT